MAMGYVYYDGALNSRGCSQACYNYGGFGDGYHYINGDCSVDSDGYHSSIDVDNGGYRQMCEETAPVCICDVCGDTCNSECQACEDGRGVTIVSCESTCSYTGYQPTHGAVDHGAFVPIVGGAYYYTTDTSACISESDVATNTPASHACYCGSGYYFNRIHGVNEPKVGGDVGGVGAIGTGTVGSYDTPGNHGYYYNPVSYTCEGPYYCYCANVRFTGAYTAGYSHCHGNTVNGYCYCPKGIDDCIHV